MTPPDTASLHYDRQHDRAWLKLDDEALARLDAATGEIIIVRLDGREVLGVLVARRVWLVVEGGLDVDAVEAVTVKRRRRA